MIIIPVLLLVIGLCVAVIAGLAWTAKLPGNNWIGIRAPEARKSKENWDITHRVAGPSWAVSAVAWLGAAALSFLAIDPEASNWMWLWVAVAVLAALAMLGVGGAMGAHTIALYDAKQSQDADKAGGSCGCCGGDGDEGSCTDSSCADPAPAVDRDALRRAAASTSCADSEDPAKDCGVEGGCGNCGLDGLCGGSH